MPTEQELLQVLQQNIDGTVVLASTARAARSLHQRYIQQQRSIGNRGWRTPQILAWEPWLKTMWDAAILSGVELRLLLNATQETELWRQVLARDESAAQTMSIAGLAEQAQQASEAAHRYQVDLHHVNSDGSIDSQAFSRWAAEVEKICRRSSLLPASQAETALARVVQAGKLRLPETIFLVGFDRVTPSQHILVEAIRVRGCDARLVELVPAGSQPSCEPAIVYAHTLDEEIDAAAHWIRTELFENPNQRIGVIVSALGEIRGHIDAAFRRVLAPSTMDVHVSPGRLPYEFSLGTPMHRAQEIRTALALLEWPLTALKPEEVTWLMVHGTFSSGSSDARAMLDKQFRKRDFRLGGPISFSAFRQWLTHIGGEQDGPALRRTLDRLAIAAKRLDLRKNRSYSEWREAMEELLTECDWNLLMATESAEYQLLRRWNVVLNELASLSVVAGAVPYSDAVDQLKNIAANMLFTLESRGAPVQILGASEAAGLTFDSLWWMNAQASCWPLRGHAQPFLPWPAQRALHMPYADPAEDAAFSLRVTRRILSSANRVIVSFALQEIDATTGSAHIPSPEIALSPVVRKVLPDAPMLAIGTFLPDQFRQPSKLVSPTDASVLETVDEETAVPFQGSQVRSGVTFLKQQAACPFRAFAEVRLASEPLEEMENGISAAAQGTILHLVLQTFWNEMQSRKKLLECSEEQNRLILRGHIQSALRRFFEHADEPWQKALLQIEADRVEARLLEWLEVEKQR
ncbi:MAG: PD-(D/E)XK nuclease family protein, partial [Acidobacteriaceae bacterium]